MATTNDIAKPPHLDGLVEDNCKSAISSTTGSPTGRRFRRRVRKNNSKPQSTQQYEMQPTQQRKSGCTGKKSLDKGSAWGSHTNTGIKDSNETSSWAVTRNENESQLLDKALEEVLQQGTSTDLESLSRYQQTTSTTPGKQVSLDESLRHAAVDHIQRLLDKWIPRHVHGVGEVKSAINPWNRTRPTLITFGSYRLGVYRYDSDLDVLALCPPEFSRGEFFSSWVDLLKRDKGISKVHPIPGAYTPVIKFVFGSKIHVDMLFARVADPTKLRNFQKSRPPLSVMGHQTQYPAPREEYKIDDSDLQDQDEAGVRSLNGARVSQILLEIVPNLVLYRKVLRAVKEWAMSKGIYSNVLGFLGGVNFAILVAWICREYPFDDAPSLMKLFFKVFSEWSWPDPVVLVPIKSTPPQGAPFMPAWDPKRYPRDRLHIMPIITPAYPGMNSAYNVGLPQLRRMQEEMRCAMELLFSKITPFPSERRRKENCKGVVMHSNSKSRNCFTCLFERSDFFHQHAYYLQIKIQANKDQDFLEWFRLVESRLRILIGNLETPEIHAWPCSHFFCWPYDQLSNTVVDEGFLFSDANYAHEALWFVGLTFGRGVEETDLAPLMSDFMHKVNSWQGKKEGMNLSLNLINGDKLPLFCRPHHNSQDKLQHQQHGILREFYSTKNVEAERARLENNQVQCYLGRENSVNGTVSFSRTTDGQVSNHASDEAHNCPQQFKGDISMCCSSELEILEGNVSRKCNGDNLSSASSSEQAETEETQSTASDNSFSASSIDCGDECFGNRKGDRMKRICLYGTKDTRGALNMHMDEGN